MFIREYYTITINHN